MDLHSIFNHLVLPPQLPGKQDPDIEDLPCSVLKRVIHACKALDALVDQPLSEAFQSVRASLDACLDLNTGRLEKTTLLEYFRHLEPNYTLILHVVEQNAALLIRREICNGQDRVIFESFEASAISEKVLAAGHALQWDFPGRSAQLPLSDFADESFQECLASFLEQASMESLYSLRASAQKANVTVIESRDTTDPALITQMLIPLLEAMGDHFQAPILRKRVRDDVNITEGDLPWRRLPFWLILRVAIQRQISLSLGNEQGRIVYKVLMCVLFTDLLKDSASSLSPELTITLRAKLCRRMAKLEMDRTKIKSGDADISESLFNRISPVIKRTIEEVTVQVESAWTSFKQATTRTVPKLPWRAPDHALRLSLLNSGEYLDRLLSDPPPQRSAPMSLDLPQPLDQAIRQTQEFTDRAFRLSAMEETMALDNQPGPGTTGGYGTHCVEYARQIDHVFDQVGPAYDSDPEQTSTMILTLFTLWIRLDKCATLACPLLGDYLPAFSPEILDVLQLPTMSAMSRLQEIQEYLARRRAKCPHGTIFGGVEEDCLAVRYVAQSAAMKSLGSRIQAASDLARDGKAAEWAKACREYEKHTAGFASGVCRCTYRGSVLEVRGCTKCWHRRARNRMKIQVHEEFLPERDTARAAVIFELAIPEYLAAYRDATWRILRELAYPSHPAKRPTPTIKLTDCAPLKPYLTAKTQRISMASTVKCFEHTHYRFNTGKVPLANLLLPLGARFELYDHNSELWVQDFKKPLTFQHLCGIHVPDGLATLLLAKQHPPPVVDGPSSYEIQANQTECPPNLSVHEFSAYQKLLAGKVRRWHNILVEMGSSNLNFSSEDTTRLLCQLAVQAGPQLPDDALRAAHVTFKEPLFLQRLGDLIEKRLQSILTNWREHNCMELLVTLILRVINMAPRTSRERVDALLKLARDATLDWTTRLRKEMRTAADADTAERAATYGFHAALLCRRTFAIYVDCGQPMNANDLSTWVQASVALQENLLVDIGKLPQTLRIMLLRDAKMSYHLQSPIETATRAYPASVGDGISKSWSDSADGVPTVFSQWIFLPRPNGRWIVATTSAKQGRFSFKQTVHYNIVEGHLMVNGKPRGKLPLEIRNDPIVQKMFGEQHLLTYPSSLAGMTHRLVSRLKGQEVHFGLRDGRVVIRTRSWEDLHEFVPESVFNSSASFDLPSELLDNCAHWLNLNSGHLEIRRRPAIWKTRPRDWIVHVPGRLAQRGGNVSLVDPRSDVFLRITKVLQDFERPEKLTAYQPQKYTARLVVELRHFELTFYVNKSGLLECSQLKAEIDPNQDAGTWYGLKSKIVLRDIKSHRRSIIVPLGPIKFRRHGMHVEVCVDGAREYGRYMIDETLHRLSCPPELRLVYTKAIFHAFTSFCLPDVLTGRTGTEESILILRSGAAQPWNSLGGTHQLVKLLGSLSPRREYYPPQLKRLQRVKWDEHLTMTIQHDAYESLCQAIIEKSIQQDKFANFGADNSDIEVPTNLRYRGEICRRLYERPTLDTAEEVVQDTIYTSRDRTADTRSGNVYEISRLIFTGCSNLHIRTRMMTILESWEVIGGFQHDDSPSQDCSPLIDRIEQPIREQWGHLVEFCRCADSHTPVLFRLALLAFGPNPNMEIIRSLAAFSCIEELRQLEPPYYDSFVEVKCRGKPSVRVLQGFMAEISENFKRTSYDRQRNRWRNAAGRDALEYQNLCEEEIQQIAAQLIQQWPNPGDELSTGDMDLRVIRADEALDAVRSGWESRRRNAELAGYIDLVQAVLDLHQSPQSHSRPLKWKAQKPAFTGETYSRVFPSISRDLVVKAGPHLGVPDTNAPFQEKGTVAHGRIPSHVAKKTSPEIMELEDILKWFVKTPDRLRRQYGSDLFESLTALKDVDSASQPDLKIREPALGAITQAIEQSRNAMIIYFAQISIATAANDGRSPWLQLGDIWPCATPVAMLELLRSSSSHNFGIGMKEALVQYGLAVTRLQRLERIRQALLQEDQRALGEELRNPGHENWSPLRVPDWLLMEIESDLLIRAEQVDVARAIIAPSSGGNSVLQMNMGKGKTSCIVPMVVAVLADGKNLSRLIVPKSLLTQTAQTVQSRLGGLVGREVRHIPFSRKTPTTPEMLELYAKMHREMRYSRGLILASHEHILSYKLGGWQHLADGNLQTASYMISFQNWLDDYCRDVLDECDYTLSVRTQLNYPGGSEMAVDGHPFRWQAAQDLLDLAAHYVAVLQEENPGSIDVLERTGSYPMVHFLNSGIEDILHDRILDDICDGRTTFLRPADASFPTKRTTIRRVLTEQRLDERMFVQASNAFTDPQTSSKVLLIVRGLVTNRILLLCLSKRWNVQYGLHPGRDPVAVPFEAKGTPSEQSEFGHPDVAILFTCLSFYYTGLTAKQFRQGLQHILQSDDPAAQYEWWSSGRNNLPEALHHWNILNIDDEGQMEELRKHLRFSRNVINHYMNHFVFPAHARQFDTKLQASAWDIPLYSKEDCGARTTGFSGTNDNRLTLPLTIRQDDLPSLRQTSAEVLSYLLQPRNRGYQMTITPEGKRLSEEELLTQLKEQHIRVLIDAGAYILEMDNETLAVTWLSIDHGAKAAVYFGNDNRAWVHYRGEKVDVPLLATPFADNLNDCLVYIDQAHTRGVDFKLPGEAHGALTLALKQTKDYTMQGAMRLRQLRTTQRVTFFAPPEVDQSIRGFCGLTTDGKLDSSYVVTWLLEQTCRTIEDLRGLHVAQGLDFCHRTDATWRYQNFLTNTMHRERLLSVIRQPERQTLEQLYGVASVASPTDSPGSLWAPQLQAFVDQLHRSRGATDIAQLGALEEVEQEREVQDQVERVRQIQKPPKYDALQFPGLHPIISRFAKTGVLDITPDCKGTTAVEHAFECVARTSLGRQYSVHNTGSTLFVSKEFGKSVKFGRRGEVADNFLRPVEWLLWCRSTHTALIVIPEEAELLIPTLRLADEKSTVHLIAYAAPVTKAMLSFNDFRYYSLPRLPAAYTFPQWIRVEVGVLAGRLYVDPAERESLVRYLRPHYEGMNLSAGGAGLELTKPPELGRFADEPAAFLLEWLALRRKVQDVLHTPIGYICSGRRLEEDC
ncbi:hypothetical protein F4677DRAFT_437927 [Hypoxylon crocopeplum]|nr:hypothetical protein F4677DRAFT_437927 [Hypoxylon crocopeplum]